MAPTTTRIDPRPATERSAARRRRSARGADQLPAFRDLVPVMAPPPRTPSDPGLGDLLDDLDPDQRRAVTHGPGPMLVVAGAGTGKTQVITRRIAWLIATRRAKPSEILALTFTDKAAEEMVSRVDRLVPYGYTDTAISTFHAFGDGLIREYALELGLPSDVRVLSRPEVVIFLREHLFEFDLDRYRPLGDPTRFLSALATLFSRCKDEDISPEAYLTHADSLATAADARPTDDPEAAAAREAAASQQELARAYVTYQRLMDTNGSIDFGDQVALALRLLRTSSVAREAVAGRFTHVLVDEFQDTNRAQAELVALVAGDHRNVTVVGDDDQAIYAFRGAAVDNILDFRERYAGARTVVLRRNYRSLGPILDASYRMIRFNDPDRLEVRTGIAKRLRPTRANGPADPVRLEAFATGSDEADWIAADIARRIAGGAAPREHAVLIRANGHGDPILRALNMAAVPWRFSGTSGLYARPEVRLLLSFLRFVADPDDSVDLYALAASDLYGLAGEDLTSIVNMARRRNRSLWAVLEELGRQPAILRLRADTRSRAERLVSDLQVYIAAAHEQPAGELLYRFLRGSGQLTRLAATDSVAAEEALGNIARFFEIVRAQSAILADDRAIFVARHLATLIEAGDDPATADLDPDADAVAVLTVHKAKGLEFPVVYLPGMVAGRFPSNGRGDALAIPAGLRQGDAVPVNAAAPSPLSEERRLCYVAMTRARDELVMSHAADYGGARARRVSPFVLESLDLTAGDRPGPGVAPPTSLDRLTAAGRTTAPAPVPRAAIEGPLSLSFYQIDDYLTCPLKYKYAHVLRVPLAPHHAIVYGAALHRAVQLYHQREARGQAMSEGELFEAFEAAWSNEGFISREHEEARLGAGREALRRFRDGQLGPDGIVPTFVEREFSFQLGGDRVRGRWDRVDAVPASGDPGAAPARVPPTAATVPPLSDVVSPTLDLLGPELVTITDYKSSDVRDPVKARQRARDSLQLQIYAMGYEAMTGRLPDVLSLHFLGSALVGSVPVEPKRLDAARVKIQRAATGIRARDYEPRPDYLACTWCAFRDICPSSVARR